MPTSRSKPLPLPRTPPAAIRFQLSQQHPASAGEQQIRGALIPLHRSAPPPHRPSRPHMLDPPAVQLRRVEHPAQPLVLGHAAASTVGLFAGSPSHDRIRAVV
jgi:hypothetical protein